MSRISEAKPDRALDAKTRREEREVDCGGCEAMLCLVGMDDLRDGFQSDCRRFGLDAR